MTTCLVTGAAGFIGSHLVESLLESGFQVIGLDNFDPYYDRALKLANLASAMASAGFEFHEGDIRDETLVASLFGQYRPDCVVHLAAKAGVRPSVQAPAEYADVNARGTAVILEAARCHGVERLIFASSSSVYGGGNTLPFREDQPVATPLSPYAASKIAGEAMCHAHHHLYGMAAICLRFFTVYGPRQRPDLAINKFLRLLLADEPITIYGDGAASRDYTYVADIVAGVRAALDSELPYGVINLGGSAPVTVRGLVAQLERVTGRTARLEYVAAQPGDMPHTFACTEKARELLNWQPQTGLAEGLQEFVEWYGRAGATLP